VDSPLILVTSDGCQTRDVLTALEARVEVCLWDGESVSSEISARAIGVWVRFQNPISAELLDGLPNLSFIATSTTGVTHLPLARMEQKGITLVRLPSKNPEIHEITSTVDLTWALILNSHTKLTSAIDSVKEGRWSTAPFVRPRQLSNCTLGLFGLGRIGSRVARVGQAFGMEVIGFDPVIGGSNFPVGQRISMADHPEEVFSSSDFVSLHMDLNQASEKSVSRAVLEKGSGVNLVNTARGELVDEGDIIWGLEEGHLSSYSADVLSCESSNQPLAESLIWQGLRRGLSIFLSPHIGGNSADSIALADGFIGDEIDKLLNKMYSETEA
jgi:phosphoglycerate dehydrogenase-like enzyme